MGLKAIVAVAMIWPRLANGYGQKDSKEDAVKNFQVEKALVLRDFVILAGALRRGKGGVPGEQLWRLCQAL